MLVHPIGWRLDKAGHTLAPVKGTNKYWTAVHLHIRGDLEFFVNDLGMSSYNSNSPCALCACNRSNVQWNHFSEHAAWLGVTYTIADFLTKYRVAGCHPVLHHPGMGPHMISLDLMHICDSNGISGIAAGNVFYDIVKFRLLPGSTSKETALAALNDKMKQWYLFEIQTITKSSDYGESFDQSCSRRFGFPRLCP